MRESKSMSASSEPPANAGLPFHPPIPLLAGLAIGFVLQHFFPIHFLRASAGITSLQLAGAVLAIAAVMLAAFAFISFRQARTSPLPDRPTTSLIVRGPFRFTRNPMYISLSLLYAAVSLFANALWPLIFLVPALAAIRYFVIAREERYLLKLFGAEYEAYCRRVRRWL